MEAAADHAVRPILDWGFWGALGRLAIRGLRFWLDFWVTLGFEVWVLRI